MRALRVVSLALSIIALAACSGGGGGGADGGGGMGGSAAQSCVDIRRCTVESGCLDEACVTTCKQRGSAAAQATYDALEQCMLARQGCTRSHPEFVEECFCMTQCRDDFTCENEVLACLGGAADQVCDICF